MSNSPLVSYTKISPNSTNPRNKRITKITPHHMAGNLSVEVCGNVFAPSSRQASSHYGIGSDGRVGMYVEEKNRAWTSSSPENDHQAVTIEVANDKIGGDWHVSDKALARLIDLCVDICQRNEIPKLIYTGDAKGNLTHHNMFAATGCPGPYLQSKMPYIAAEVNKRLGSGGTVPPTPTPPTDGATFGVGDTVNFTGAKHYTSSNASNGKSCKPGPAKVTAIAMTGKHRYHLVAVAGKGSNVYGWVDTSDISATGGGSPAATNYLVRVTADELNIRTGPGTNYGTNGSITDKGVYTIVAEAAGAGATKWGKLKSGVGWISLDFVKKV